MAIKLKNTGTTTANELNFIGAGTVLEGSIETQGSLRVDGRVKGKVKSGDTLTIGAAGEIEGDIFARNAVVGGRIKGNISVDEKLILESTSILMGNLKASKLIIDEGAVFNGKSAMGKEITSLPFKKLEAEEASSIATQEVASEAPPK